MEESHTLPPELQVELMSLSSKQFTGAMVKQLAVDLGLPISGSLEDVRQLVAARLQERGHEPMKVQVMVSKSDQSATLVLEDTTSNGGGGRRDGQASQ